MNVSDLSAGTRAVESPSSFGYCLRYGSIITNITIEQLKNHIAELVVELHHCLILYDPTLNFFHPQHE